MISSQSIDVLMKGLFVIALAVIVLAFSAMIGVGSSQQSAQKQISLLPSGVVVGVADAQQRSRGAPAAKSKRPNRRGQPTRRWKKRYAQAKRLMNRCKPTAYRRILPLRKVGIRVYGYRFYHNLALSAWYANKKKVASRWASRGLKAAPYSGADQMMVIRMGDIRQYGYRWPCPVAFP